MTESDIKIYDEFIREQRLLETTSMPIDILRQKVARAITANNFAYTLADVVNSFIIDCDGILRLFDKSFSHQSRMYFNHMRQNIAAARKWSDKLSEPMYECRRADCACADSDWWLALIKLIDDRVAENPQRTTMLLEFLLSMPEGDSVYKVKSDDFKVFKP